MSKDWLKTLFSFSATVCAMAVTIIFLGEPCQADQPGTANNPPTEEVTASADNEPEAYISVIGERLKEEEKTQRSAFGITPHRQVYLLLATYDSHPNTEVYDFANEDAPKHTEAMFQLSFKIKLWENVFNGNGDLYCAYTQRSFWQVYDEVLSSPFRETNYEPEVFVKFDTDFDVLGFKHRAFTIGFNHQSNGRSGVRSLSRSWNRVYADFIVDRGNLAIGLKPWYRIPEDDEDDDNPDIAKYMGYGELFGAYKIKGHVFSFMFRNNLRGSGNKGAVELGWSYPIIKNLRLYIQYFNGYGVSLVDYNDPANRIGVGLMLFDWL